MMQPDLELPSYVTYLRWGAFSILALATPVVVFNPQVRAVFEWFTDQSADWWGAAGQWAGAIAGFAAAFVALWIAKTGAQNAAKIAEKGARANEAREQRRRRVEAMFVYGRHASTNGSILRFHVINNSNSAMIDVKITEVKSLPKLPTPLSQSEESSWMVLPPGERRLFDLTFGMPYAILSKHEHIVVIEFTDMEGYRWRREGDSLPELVE
ncbi:hypothetical protein [Actinosynnema sp.]|uniref:hypothetical protein n=1 Tax=Actinosynnema sp. TaxID=1872144 RepID=UPI003F86792C